MREIFINKNLCLMYWLRQRIGKRKAVAICRRTEKAILFFGRPRYHKAA